MDTFSSSISQRIPKAPQPARRGRPADEVDHLRDQYVALASHQLRTPLTSISGFSSTLVRCWDTLSGEERLQFAQIIDEQAQRMDQLINDVLVLSKVNSGALKSDPRMVNIGTAISSIAAEFANFGIEISCAPQLWAYVDPLHLHQALVNYVTNAIKYGEAPLSIEATRNGPWIDIIVVDHGEGVDAQFVPHLFDEFARAERSIERALPGTGLGLSIVRLLMRAQGVATWYEPGESSGSRFCLRIPASAHQSATRLPE